MHCHRNPKTFGKRENGLSFESLQMEQENFSIAYVVFSPIPSDVKV